MPWCILVIANLCTCILRYCILGYYIKDIASYVYLRLHHHLRARIPHLLMQNRACNISAAWRHKHFDKQINNKNQIWNTKLCILPTFVLFGEGVAFFKGKRSDTFAAKLSNQAMRRGALKQDFWKNLWFCPSQVDPQFPSPLPESQNPKLKKCFIYILGYSKHVIFSFFIAFMYSHKANLVLQKKW